MIKISTKYPNNIHKSDNKKGQFDTVEEAVQFKTQELLKAFQKIDHQALTKK